MNRELLQFGLDSKGRLVFIDEVVSGLKCHCTCPYCGEDFVARKGRTRLHSFSHRSGRATCRQDAATYRLRHLQQVILEAGGLRAPLSDPLAWAMGMKPLRGHGQTGSAEEPAGAWFPVATVRLRQRVGHLNPHLLLASPDGVLWGVEVLFAGLRGPEDQHRLETRLAASQFPWLELDLRSFHVSGWNSVAWRHAVLDELPPKYWRWPPSEGRMNSPQVNPDIPP
jgi:competence protein CoiA